MKAFYLISWPMRLVALQGVFLVVKAETKRGGKRRLEEKMCPKKILKWELRGRRGYSKFVCYKSGHKISPQKHKKEHPDCFTNMITEKSVEEGWYNGHAKLNGEKSKRPQCYTKNNKQMMKSGSGVDSLLRARAQELDVQWKWAGQGIW